MTTTPPTFHAGPADAAGVITWVHIGDLHMKQAGEQNHLDLQSIVQKINSVFAHSTSFVYLPGDVAEDGSKRSYDVVRRSLGQLKVPWCAIIGDHDVQEQHFENFLRAMSDECYYAFAVGETRFLALNAFDEPHPASFAILPRQLSWLERGLEEASGRDQEKVILLHCYPTDLKIGSEPLRELVRRYGVKLIDMGHTHYNEISNDGRTLYTATRSTGQIEEGPVGFSVTNLDSGVVSWRFIELSQQAAVMITLPGDERLLTDAERAQLSNHRSLKVRAKVWGLQQTRGVYATISGIQASLQQIAGSQVWETVVDTSELAEGMYPLAVRVQDTDGTVAQDEIRIYVGAMPAVSRQFRDQDNALTAWPEHGLVGTQLGPNKNGRKW